MFFNQQPFLNLHKLLCRITFVKYTKLGLLETYSLILNLRLSEDKTSLGSLRTLLKIWGPKSETFHFPDSSRAVLGKWSLQFRGGGDYQYKLVLPRITSSRNWSLSQVYRGAFVVRTLWTLPFIPILYRVPIFLQVNFLHLCKRTPNRTV